MEITILTEDEIGARPSWDEHGMVHAIAAATRSSCKNVRAGSAFAYEHAIIGTGYNGASSKIKESCLKTGCRKELMGLDYHASLGCGECIGIHSEKNALRYSRVNLQEMGKIEVYNTIFPCHTCAKDLTPYMKRIVFKRLYSEKELNSTLQHFSDGGVEVCQLDLSPERFLDIFFNQPDVHFDIWSKEEKEGMNEFLEGLRERS